MNMDMEMAAVLMKPVDTMTDDELEKLYRYLATAMVAFSERAELDGGSSRARLLWYSLGGHLADHEILQGLAACAVWMEEQRRKNQPGLSDGGMIH